MTGETILFKPRKLHCLSLDNNSENRPFMHQGRPIAIFERRSTDADYIITVLRASDKIILQPGALESRKQNCPFDYLASALESLAKSVDCSNLTPYADIPFKYGFLGYLGYGLTASQATLAIPRQKQRFIDVPDAALIVPGAFSIEDRKNGKLYLISDIGIEECTSLTTIAPYSVPTASCSSIESKACPSVDPSMTKEEYIDRVKRAKEYINEGEAFQIVLAQRFSCALEESALALFDRIRQSAAAPYAYYLDLDDFQYLGFSPESMISIEGDNVSFRALAGTRPRGKDQVEDNALADELRENEKENAEHMMLVDLGRNDLGRVCLQGSIAVDNLKQILKYPNVMHLSTDLKGRLDSTIGPLKAVGSCFPRGTVSGAPKRRALTLLAELEPERRGIYSGAVGTIEISGNIDLAIAIRSATIKDGIAHVQAGAGIVYDSIPECEYEETRIKAASIIDHINRSWRSQDDTNHPGFTQLAYQKDKHHDHTYNRQL
ncbi:anthranilate synthase component I [bacterium]|nr:anthranilate synthase component I [bacterium]